MMARHPYGRGDVLLIQFPFSGLAGQKDRPAVVISADIYHDRWDELLVVALTSKVPKTLRPTDYQVRDWQAAGLQQPSWMRSHLATVHYQLVMHKIGSLAPSDMQAVEVCLRIALQL
jgi:mRNA-degrading endonuclease toxin of MazEF toxin-antitoxin module